MLVRVYASIGTHHLSIVAAGVAFFSALAIFPAIAALIGIYGLVADPAGVSQNLEAVRPLLPPDAYSILEAQVNALIAARPEQLGFASGIAILLALWTARAGVMAMMEGVNIAYREPDARGFVMQFVISLALTALMILVGVVAILSVVALPAILNFIEIGPLGALIARLGPLLILGIAVIFAIGALYRYGPNRQLARKRWVSWGAIVATIGWVAASMLLSFYISNFANFNQTYGSLGAIVALLFWFYISAFVVLLGAELNAEMELQTGQDTTTGQPKPRGERGAFVADNVA